MCYFAEINFHKCRIFFKATEERQSNPLSVWPEFDGIPFIVLGRKFYGCHLGKDKDYGAKRKLRDTNAQVNASFHNIPCMARMVFFVCDMPRIRNNTQLLLSITACLG